MDESTSLGDGASTKKALAVKARREHVAWSWRDEEGARCEGAARARVAGHTACWRQ